MLLEMTKFKVLILLFSRPRQRRAPLSPSPCYALSGAFCGGRFLFSVRAFCVVPSTSPCNFIFLYLSSSGSTYIKTAPITSRQENFRGKVKTHSLAQASDFNLQSVISHCNLQSTRLGEDLQVGTGIFKEFIKNVVIVGMLVVEKAQSFGHTFDGQFHGKDIV
jgi:hypothetical protein